MKIFTFSQDEQDFVIEENSKIEGVVSFQNQGVYPIRWAATEFNEQNSGQIMYPGDIVIFSEARDIYIKKPYRPTKIFARRIEL